MPYPSPAPDPWTFYRRRTASYRRPRPFVAWSPILFALLPLAALLWAIPATARGAVGNDAAAMA